MRILVDHIRACNASGTPGLADRENCINILDVLSVMTGLIGRVGMRRSDGSLRVMTAISQGCMSTEADSGEFVESMRTTFPSYSTLMI